MGTVSCTCCTNRKDDKLLAEKILDSSPAKIRHDRKRRNALSGAEKYIITKVKIEDEAEEKTVQTEYTDKGD